MSDKPFLHERDDFAELILIVSDRLERPQALVEKDYWVTHTLWSLQKQGFTVLFKGGTSLSKGYHIIERFSEDLDIKLESDDLPSVDWKRDCVYPRVTLLEKIEAIARAFDNRKRAATAFARHYEDAFRIIRCEDLDLSELNKLLAEMKETGDIANWPLSSHKGFQPDDSGRWQELDRAWQAIASMFWGERHTLDLCSDAIRRLLVALEEKWEG